MAGRITVVGAGVSGQAIALWAKKLGASVFVTDMKKELAPEICLGFRNAGIEWETGGHSPRCCECDQMVVSSGVSPACEAVKQAEGRGIPVVGELEFLAPWLPGKTIAVTGTNGKTTTTALLGHLLRCRGQSVAVVGNIGEPLANAAGTAVDYTVMELSSFQLHWNKSFTPQVALLTNLAPDHIDWHGSYENYVADKLKVFGRPGKGNWEIVQARDAALVPSGGSVCTLGGTEGTRIYWDDQAVWLERDSGREKLFDRSQLSLVGQHNLENAAMAGAALALIDKSFAPLQGLSDFLPPPHRCQLVRVRRGVTWVDDSKGTNVASTRTALEGIDGPKIIILGGKGKGEKYETLAQTVKARARNVILIGAESDKIEAALREAGVQSIHRTSCMEEVVSTADGLARPGDTVLLSPACTSWDMYQSYEQRGDHFKRLVMALPD